MAHEDRRRLQRIGRALGLLAVALGVVALLVARREEHTPPASFSARIAAASPPARTPAEAAEWRATQHARVAAARRHGDAARTRGDLQQAEARFEDGFAVAQEILLETEQDGDAELDAAVMLIELADLGKRRGLQDEQARRRRGAGLFLERAKLHGVKDQPLLDATLARAVELGGTAP